MPLLDLRPRVVVSEWRNEIGRITRWEKKELNGTGRRTSHVAFLVQEFTSLVAMSFVGSRREPRKLDSSSVVPVYVGQADNVRPDYNEIFSKDLSMAYRWAPMKSKKDAKNTEDQLLEKYDYAWNKRSNGGRRPDDILKKLDCSAKKSQFRYSLLPMMLQCFHQKQVGDKLRTCDQFFLENNQFNSAIGAENKGIMSRIFGIMRLQPGRPQSGFRDDSKGVCGITIGHGSVCTKAP
ncbi:UNVERIFIED_CONTAM: hypothetical protein Slati_2866300 [Sesamum latifolium]|uniref:Uncharacterized protein n=1 Tax=Sesamum latifolium TaxID=2727402 RepID=A0AAW2VF88_9LAMI